ncbi:23S rRNA (uridine(2552)-2'-O)-methyltransferase RlmE [Thiohalomonas denitrificans]|nr:23S rRNA (uridine(2552)-2'-O)-methyltransferase RlmE [Thiohalomonas denitrificans]
MARSKSSKKWLNEHFEDEFVKRSQAEGFRSRAVYKLTEIDEKDRLLRPGITVIDLGAAPGGWSQVAADRVGAGGMVVALDVLPMDPLPGVKVLLGDFREQEVLDHLLSVLDRPADLVLSDMSPNISGMRTVDQPKAMYLAELTLELARQTLSAGGGMVVKVFQGEGFDAFLKEVRDSFQSVAIRKPKASRPRSREVYIVARNYHV